MIWRAALARALGSLARGGGRQGRAGCRRRFGGAVFFAPDGGGGWQQEERRLSRSSPNRPGAARSFDARAALRRLLRSRETYIRRG